MDPDQEHVHEAERLSPAPPVEDRSAGAVLRGAFVDLGPLRRHRDFRLLFIGQLVTDFGSMVTYVAIPYQAYAISHSSLIVGAISAVQLVPLVAMALYGGALADALDRRRLVLWTEFGFMVASGLLLANALAPHPYLWALFVIGAAGAGLAGLQRPPLDALTPRLVDRDQIASASALESVRHNGASIAGPALAGVLIAAGGVKSAYLFDIATFVVSLVALAAMRSVPPPLDAAPVSVRRIVEGLRYAKSRPELLGTYGVDIVAMFFGMPLALMPALASHLGGARALGLLYAGPEIGSFIGAVGSGWTLRVFAHGKAVCLAAAGWGLGVTALAFAPDLGLAVCALAFAGFCDQLSGIFRGRIWNETIPDSLRGRLAGIEQVSYSSGPLLGDLESGIVAALASVRASIASGGILCVAGVGVAVLALPRFWRYDSRQAKPSAEEG